MSRKAKVWASPGTLSTNSSPPKYGPLFFFFACLATFPYEHISICKMDNQQKPTVQHMELSSMLQTSLDGRGVWGRMYVCMCMAESSHCSPETTPTLLIGYAPIQNKKFKVWKNCKKRKDHIRKLWFSHMLYCILVSDVAEEKSDANLILILFSEICFFSLIALRIFFHFWCCKISLLHDSVQVFSYLFCSAIVSKSANHK